jgi:diaminopimelate epimerase
VSQPRRFRWLKGHGTQNDFVLLPDPDGTVHGRLDAAFVAGLCHRRAGLGADGVLRVVRTDAFDDPHAAAALEQGAGWFMDYRNADGSVSEMCGNGIRVFALHLLRDGLVPPDEPLGIGTRDGVKTVSFTPDGQVSVDMGMPQVGAHTWVELDGRRLPAAYVDMGNPHAVAFVDALPTVATLPQPAYDSAVYPEGVNVELVTRRGPDHLAMRVYERGSGETRSCGTGACAVMAAAAVSDGSGAAASYRVDVPGGRLQVTWDQHRSAVLTGPAVIVADGEMSWLGA